MGGVGANGLDVGVDRYPYVTAGIGEAVARREHYVLQRDPVLTRLGPAGLKAREVEELVDERRQLLTLLDDGLAQLGPLGGGEGVAAQGVAGGDDRRDRSAQVV